MQQIEGRLKRQLLEITRASSPHEACGLLMPTGEIKVLANRSLTPTNAFEVTKTDILQALASEESLENITFWHSHPSGGVGPSRVDLQQKMPFPYHLVLSLVDNDLVPTWY